MIDINTIRNDSENISSLLQARGFSLDMKLFNKLEGLRKKLQVDTQEIQQERNKLSKDIGILKSNGEDTSDLMQKVSSISTKSKNLENELLQIQIELNNFLLNIPNIPHDSVPLGKDESFNKVIKTVGNVSEYNFDVKDHVELGKNLGLDFEVASKISGSRFAFMTNGVARLHRAIGQFMLDKHVDEHGYTECYTPYLVNEASLIGTGQLPKFAEDLFLTKKSDNENLYLIPTSEVPLTNSVRDQILDEGDLPIKLTAHTPCFRSEAGSYGKDTKGMIRQHQFDKVEMVQITSSEDSYKAHEEMLSHAENILKSLELPYRVVILSSGDMGFGAAKTFDIEVWIPSQKQYREISSISNCEAFQARRLKARYKKNDGKKELVHTLNGSGLAVGRTLVAIIENNQLENGEVKIPKVLQNYMNGEKVISIR
jgi:seryl-tRNA synthetase